MHPVRARLPFVAAMIATIALLAGCPKWRRGNVFEVPPGYRGWVVVEYGNPDCGEFPIINNRRQIKVASDGRACTKDPVAEGLGRDSYVETIDDGRMELIDEKEHADRTIWGRSTVASGNGERAVVTIQFFVGTGAEHERAARKRRRGQ